VERVILAQHQQAVRGRRVLDIGCGTGRTTAALLAAGAVYTGIDYSPGMLAEFRRRFPAVTALECDMRDLGRFAAGSFDFVLCSFNTLDYVSHEDRLRTLREIRRVLVPGGLLAFSSHNRNIRGGVPGPRPEWSRNPLRWAADWNRFLAARRNHARLRGQEIVTSAYAVLNDCAHTYTLMTYYITRERQIDQLEQCGFRCLAQYDRAGRSLAPGDDDSGSSFIYYVAEPRAD
jgi:SAM-dependent methyltransferase